MIATYERELAPSADDETVDWDEAEAAGNAGTVWQAEG